MVADNILKIIFFNEKFSVLNQISVIFVPGCPIVNKSALVHVITHCLLGATPWYD